MTANILGIDHPLVTVRDLDGVRDAYRRLGFKLTPRGYHPWGTANHFALFDESFIELIGVHDSALLGQGGVADGSVFSGHIGNFLRRREGLSLLALHSDDAQRDHGSVAARGFQSKGLVTFHRAVTLPDGTQDEAVVTLAMMINDEYPNISTFICQQHRPELVWVPAWLDHPNGVVGILGVSYVADEPAALAGYYRALLGHHAVQIRDGSLWAQTPRGYLEIIATARLAARFPQLEVAVPAATDRPCGVAIRLHSPEPQRLRACLRENQVPWIEGGDGVVRVSGAYAGAVILEFDSTL